MSSDNPCCTKVGLQMNYGWPTNGMHKCSNTDCENMVECVPINSPLCPNCHSKYSCRCFRCEPIQIRSIGMPISTMGRLSNYDFDGDELNLTVKNFDLSVMNRKPSLSLSHFRDPLFIEPDNGSYEIRPIGMEKQMTVVPKKEDDIEKLLLSDTKKTTQREDVKSEFKRFQKNRTKAKNPNNRTTQT